MRDPITGSWYVGGGECLYCSGERPGELYDDRRGYWVACHECDGTGRDVCAVCHRRLEEDCTVTIVRPRAYAGDPGSESPVCSMSTCVAKEIDDALERMEQKRANVTGRTQLERQLALSLVERGEVPDV